jgi:eukaryotic-like serine/threonine-protein kinase
MPTRLWSAQPIRAWILTIMNADRCPHPHALHRLLNNQLGRAVEGQVVAHIETCKRCRDQFESFTTELLREAYSQKSENENGMGGHNGASFAQAGPGATTDFGPPEGLADTDDAMAGGLVEAGATGEYRPERNLPKTDDARNDPAEADTDPAGTVTQSGSAGGQSPAGPRPGQPRSWPVIPGYELVSKLGEGGMGVVFLARQIGLNRLVAVKMIRGGSQARPEHFSRFRIEAEAVAQLRHPNIVQIHDIGEVDGLPYFSLELLEGGSLDDRLAATPQPSRQAAELVATLAQAVGVAHAAGIIHRDLKPTNVLYSAEGVPKITDFGLAKRMESDSRQTETGAIMGSPSYMAPEQARGHTRDVGPAADVYALGAILYEMLTGRPPFKGATPIETVRQVTDDEVVPPSRLVPKVARDLETICLKCLQKEPSKRYPLAIALRDDLVRFRNGETILARRTPAIERGIKWARRRPGRAALYLAAAVAFLGLTVGGAYVERVGRLRESKLSQRAVALMREGSELIDSARDATSAAHLTEVQANLSKFLGRLDNQDHERIAGLPDRIRASLADLDRRLDELRDRDEKQQLERVERKRFQEFLYLRSRAQLAAVGFELDPASRRARLAAAARQALSVYARDPAAADDVWALADRLPGSLSPAEKGRITEGCYDLLLMLSQATEPTIGLKILDRAVPLRPQSTAAYHLRRADCLHRAGDRDGGAREEALAAGRPSVDSADHLLIGREQMAHGRWIEAIASLDASVRLDPDQLAARLLLAICDFNIEPKRLGEARDHLNACLRAQPELIELYLLRARVHGEEGNQALAHVATAQPAERPTVRRQAATAFEAAVADYRAALDRLPSDDFRYVLLVNRGGMFLQADRLAESQADLEAAIALQPGLYQAHATQGQLEQRRGNFDLASAAFGRAIDHANDPGARVALLRTRALLHANRREATPPERTAALRDLDLALRLEPGDAPERAGDLVERARILFGLTRYDEALTACGDALALAPDHADAHQLRISALMALKRYDDVLNSCDAYLAGGKPTVEILEIRGLARIARRNHSGAVTDYTRAIELRADLDAQTRSRLLNHRGWAFQFADAPRLALEDFEVSLRLVKDQSDAYAGRGLARVRLGEWRKAVVDAEDAVRLAQRTSGSSDGVDDQVQAQFNAARIYAQAIDHAAREVGREGERAVARYRAYRLRAIELLQQALKGVADPVRRKEIMQDPALRPLSLAPPDPASRTTARHLDSRFPKNAT